MSLKINSPIGGLNPLDPVNAPEINISDNADILEEVAEDAAYDTYETSKKEDDSAYEEARRDN